MKRISRSIGAVCALALALPLVAQAQSYSKTETLEYHDDLSLWVLGQVKRTTTDGIETSKTTYEWRAVPTKFEKFGKLVQTVGYDMTSSVASGQLGTVKTVQDGNNNLTTATNWKRGIPQNVAFADGTSIAASVDDRGWIAWAEDENRSRTCYGYDAMGRLASTTYTSESAPSVCDASKWTPTTYTWEYRNLVEHGLPAGHWLRRNHTGNHRRNTFYDALWRPILEHYYDGANVDATVQTRAWSYDAQGRVTFEAYPVNALTAGTKGTWTEYDALGRVTSVSQDSELAAPNHLLVTTTEYLAGFKTRTTSPRGVQTVTEYQTFDTPTTDAPVRITRTAGSEVIVNGLARNVFGNIIQLTQRNTSGTERVDRFYSYDAYQQLCRTIEPETGATLMGYDAAGNLSWSAAGLPSGTACEANGTSAAVSLRRVGRTYDARNRLKTLFFPDGRGNQAWNYTANGLPLNITVNNSAGGDVVRTDYLYHRRGQLTRERLLTDAVDWPYAYAYNGNGHLASNSWHGITVDYAPNALGQPTQAGTYATGVQYYPNGGIKQFTYGNGLVHTMTQNARQLPARSLDSGGILDLSYAYDSHGNVITLTDATAGARQSRSMIYDGFDRLRQTTGVSFTAAAYTYDALDNLKALNVTGGSAPRNHTYLYDATNRLGSVTHTIGGATVIGLSYDVQGNLANKNGQLYQFDYGNRLRNVPGKESYRYDGHGRRVMSYTTTHSLWQYGNSGAMYYSHDARNNRATSYIHLQGSLLATRETPITGGTGTYTVKYQHTDALGTPIKTTDATGAVVETSEYEPYGQLINRPITDGPGYTGHVQDAATGLTYMQQRYYDPHIGQFLSVDPVTAYSSPVTQFHRYRYANNNPYRFTDPDGRLSRGTGFDDKQWKRFDSAQQRAAGSLEKGAAKITRALETGKGMRGVTRSFERNFGSGTATPENMAKVASDMSSMAGALRDTGPNAIPANGMSAQAMGAAFNNMTADTLMGVPTTGPKQVFVNLDHSQINNASKVTWGVGHEMGHAVLGYPDQRFNGHPAYKFGDPDQQDSFKNLPGQQRLINPDHLMDFVR